MSMNENIKSFIEKLCWVFYHVTYLSRESDTQITKLTSEEPDMLDKLLNFLNNFYIVTLRPFLLLSVHPKT